MEATIVRFSLYEGDNESVNVPRLLKKLKLLGRKIADFPLCFAEKVINSFI